MQPFQPAYISEAEQEKTRQDLVTYLLKNRSKLADKSDEDIFNLANEITLREQHKRYYKNDIYQVSITPVVEIPGWPHLVELSIKRIDRKPIFDWRQLQLIKNELLGAENEAVMLFPAKSRTVDSSNQYYLFGIAQEGVKFPFGFSKRLVTATPMGKSQQRPFTEEDKKKL